MQPFEDSLTYMNALEARYHKSMAPDCEYKVLTDSSNAFIHVEDIEKVGSTVPEEEHNILFGSTKSC
jgi:hypothetical protein